MVLQDDERTFLGLDLSTQQLKAAVVDNNLELVVGTSVQFDSDLPEFRTHSGVITDKSQPELITAPTLMWVKALDMLLDKLTVAGVNFEKIAAVSFSAQQHGSVYWQKGSENLLRNLVPDQFLHQQLATTFSVTNSPIWMDSSTSKQCRQLEAAIGGPRKLAEITGSRAYERFTGSQIAKIYQTKPESYKNTERISLVSSFLASLFAGKVAPIDLADGSGMNLMDINTKTWHRKLLDTTAPQLEDRLGQPVPSNTVIGNISSYFVERYSFNPECKIICGTGDNPASLVGMRLNEGWVAVSLGTSDTVFLWLEEPQVVLDGHILCNPVDPAAYMALLCFKNGSLTRERLRDQCAEGSWDIFNQLLDNTPRGNFGNMGLYFDNNEILPFLSGDYRFNKAGERVTKFTSLEVEVRALIEGQFIAKRAYAEDIGFKMSKSTKILATGGAANNPSILQVLSDVFNAPVYLQEETNSAALGAAYLAKYGLLSTSMSFQTITSTLPEPHLFCKPYPDADDIYRPMVQRYRDIVQELTSK